MWSFLASFIQPALSNPLVVGFGIGIVRSAIGWLEGVARDWHNGKRIRRPDFGKFVETMMRIIPQAVALEVTVPGGAVAAMGTDYAIEKFRKKK